MTDSAPLCIECGGASRLVGGLQVYPHRPDLAHKRFWLCSCGAKVGCHPNTERPLGLPCAQRTANARRKVHQVFDLLWETKMRVTGVAKHRARQEAYRWLAEQLQIDGDDCHISHFGYDRCRAAYKICAPIAAKLRLRLKQAQRG